MGQSVRYWCLIWMERKIHYTSAIHTIRWIITREGINCNYCYEEIEEKKKRNIMDLKNMDESEDRQSRNLHSPPTLEVLAQVAAALPGFGIRRLTSRWASIWGSLMSYWRATGNGPWPGAWGPRGGRQSKEGVKDVLQGRGAGAGFVPKKSCRSHCLLVLALSRS